MSYSSMDEEKVVEVKEYKSEIALVDFTNKKKKKKCQYQVDDFANCLAEDTENLTITDGVESSFVYQLKKMTMAPVEVNILNYENVDLRSDSTGEEEGEEIAVHYPWDGSDRGYAYEELLSRLVNLLGENKLKFSGDRRRTVMMPPRVLREGTEKTIFVNFMDLCITMHRRPEHVMTFLLAEMGTSGSLDGQQRLVVNGRFAPKNFEGILHRYITEYVKCGSCKSPDTILTKENRQFFLRCEQCGSGQSVAPITAGFVAKVGL